MIEGLRPYPEMQSTGHPWLPSIPAHWDVRRNGRLFSQRCETGYPDLPILEVSLRSGVRIRDMQGGKRKQQIVDRSVYQRAGKGDIAYNMMRMWQGAVGIAPADGLVSPAYVVAKAHEGVDAAYYAYLFRTDDYMKEIDSFSRGIVPDRNRLYWQAFKQMPSAYPPLDEQRLIVSFLDWHGAMTGKLIRAKRRLIELLNEQKQSIIHRAVTRGLNPAVKLKSSGVDWLGDVPDHWEVKRLKNVADVVLGKMLTPSSKGGDQLRPYLRSANIQWEKPDVRDVREMWISDREVNQLLVRKGDLLVSEGGEVGRACLWNDELPECYIQNSVHRVVARPGILPMFILLLFTSDGKRGRFDAAVNRVSIAHLTREKLVALAFPVPPLDEQSRICSWIEDASAPLTNAIMRTQDEIALIQEFRTRLIADVVTGQLDVRAVAASLPDVIEVDAAGDLTDEDDLDADADDLIDAEEAA